MKPHFDRTDFNFNCNITVTSQTHLVQRFFSQLSVHGAATPTTPYVSSLVPHIRMIGIKYCVKCSQAGIARLLIHPRSINLLCSLMSVLSLNVTDAE